MPSPALTRYSFPNLSALYGVLPRASALALRDAAFDRGLATFNDAGQPQFARPPRPRLSQAAQAELRWQEPIPLTTSRQNQSLRQARDRF